MVLALFQIGLPGVALVLTYGQLVSQIFVEEFTLQFLNLPGCEFVVRLSLGKTFGGHLCRKINMRFGSNLIFLINVISRRSRMDWNLQLLLAPLPHRIQNRLSLCAQSPS